MRRYQELYIGRYQELYIGRYQELYMGSTSYIASIGEPIRKNQKKYEEVPKTLTYLLNN